MRRFLRFLRLYGPGVALMLAIAIPHIAFAQNTPADLTTRSCTLGNTWWDGINRIILGVSAVLFGLALVAGLNARNSSGGGGGGGEMVGGAIGGVAGLGILLGVMGMVGVIAAVARTAAGGYACP